MQHAPRRGASPTTRVVCWLVATLVAGVAWAGEPPPSWHVTPRLEHSAVTVNGNEVEWNSASFTVDRALGDGASCFAGVQWQQRNNTSDAGVQLGGTRRIGEWKTAVAAELSPGADFLPTWALEVQADREVGKNLRGGLGARRMSIANTHITLWSPYVTYYRGNDEFGVAYRSGRNAGLDHDIRVLQLRAVATRGNNQFGAYLARGEYLFDALGVPGGQGSGWSAYIAVGHALTRKARLRMEVGQGSESRIFRQRSVALSFRYSP